MSRILRRPMFRGGPVDSYGTGIATGLGQPRIGARYGRFFGDRGNPYVPEPLKVGQVSQGGLAKGRFNFGLPPISSPMPDINEFASLETMTDSTKTGDSYLDNIEKEDELINVGDVELDLPKSKVEDLTTEKVVEKVKDGDDEVEVTMTDLEKALGLDKARRRDLGDMLGRASAAFLGAGDVREGLAEFMAAEAKAGPSRTERIKSIAGLEEYKSKKAKEIAKLKLENKTYAPGNAQKNYEFFLSQGVDKDQALNLAMGKARNFDEAFLNLSAKGTVTAKLFDTLARQEGIDPLPQVDIETLEVGETYYLPGAKSLVKIVIKEGKKDLLQTPY